VRRLILVGTGLRGGDQPKDFSQLTQPHTTLSTSSAISFGKDPPNLSRVGDEHVARRSRGRLKIFETQNSRVLLSTT
jgi:hypothetical protein